MIQRFYFDTSVFGGMYDIEFEKETILLFEKVSLGQIICVYSNLTESELSNSPQQVKDFFQNLKDEHKEVVSVIPESLQLAQTHIAENIVGQTSIDDCIHIATATFLSVGVPPNRKPIHSFPCRKI